MNDAAWGDFGDRDPYIVALKNGARSVGVSVTKIIVLTGPTDVPAALDTLRNIRPHAVMIGSGPALQPHTKRFLDFLSNERLPTLS